MSGKVERVIVRHQSTATRIALIEKKSNTPAVAVASTEDEREGRVAVVWDFETDVTIASGATLQVEHGLGVLPEMTEVMILPDREDPQVSYDYDDVRFTFTNNSPTDAFDLAIKAARVVQEN